MLAKVALCGMNQDGGFVLGICFMWKDLIEKCGSSTAIMRKLIFKEKFFACIKTVKN